MYSIRFRHLILPDGIALEVLDATTNAFSFGRFQLRYVRYKCPRHTVNCWAHIDIEDVVGYFSVKIGTAVMAFHLEPPNFQCACGTVVSRPLHLGGKLPIPEKQK